MKWLRRIYQEHTGISAEDEGTNANILWLDYNTRQCYRNFRFFVPPDDRSPLPIPGGYKHGGPWLLTLMPKPGKEQKYFVVDRLDGHRSKYSRVSQLKKVIEELKSCWLRWHYCQWKGCTEACIGAIRVTLDSLMRLPGLKEVTTTGIPNKFCYNFFKLHADKIPWYGCFSLSSIQSLKTISYCADTGNGQSLPMRSSAS